jgi:hypothetical protein
VLVFVAFSLISIFMCACADSFRTKKQNILHTWRWPCRPKHVAWTSTTKRKTIYKKAARRRQLNLKSYWTIQCNRMLTYSIMNCPFVFFKHFMTEIYFLAVGMTCESMSTLLTRGSQHHSTFSLYVCLSVHCESICWRWQFVAGWSNLMSPTLCNRATRKHCKQLCCSADKRMHL